jgi:metallophosphoesterase superfamily enzyme
MHGSADREALGRLQNGRDWIWIAGNHDPHISTDLGGKCLDEVEFGGIAFRHEPRVEMTGQEIAGHLHPVARVLGAGGTIRRRCFVSDGQRCIMPAFGAYAGGLNWCDPVFAPLFSAKRAFAHVMGRERVYKISAERCLPG